MNFIPPADSIEALLLILSLLLLLSVATSRIASVIGIPALLVFLTVGMLAGSEGVGGIYFDDAKLSQYLGVTALAFILFSGGISTDWREIKPVVGEGLMLATVGVFLTMLFVAVLAYFLLDFTWLEGLLIGAISSSTDAAAVFSILRSKGIRLRRRLTPLLELESGSNDPMSVFLTIAIIGLLLNPASSPWAAIPVFLQQMLIGAGVGIMIGRVIQVAVNSIKLDHDGLYSILLIAAVGLTYGLTASLDGSGFLAVYLAGIVLGNSDFLHKRSLVAFSDGVAWLMQLTMFFTLGLLVFPSRVFAVASSGLIVSLGLILLARPLAVFLCLLPFRRSWREKLFISWVGLRGATPIILATFPLLAGTPKADSMFNLVFFVVVSSVLLQGPTIALAARLLGVQAPARSRPAPPLIFDPAQSSSSRLTEIQIKADSSAVSKRLVDLKLPEGLLVLLVYRGKDYFAPNGSTAIEAGDVLFVLSERSHTDRLAQCFRSKVEPGTVRS